eukprot:10999623-Ditylum_brightwellii.AAC.1
MKNSIQSQIKATVDNQIKLNIKGHLQQNGYALVKHTPELWKHNDHDITLFLIVNDFRIEYTKDEDAEHLVDILQKIYKVHNFTACGIVNKMVKQRRTSTIDMWFYWVRDHCVLGHFLVYWVSSTENMGNYHTKHQTGVHHRRIQPNICMNPDIWNSVSRS